MDLSIVVPVWHAEDRLEFLLAEIQSCASQLTGEFEVIFVDDGSQDNTWKVVELLANRYPDQARGVRLGRNFGQHSALLCGLRHSLGRWVGTMDDDFQHPPEELAKLWRTAQSGEFDIVYGHYTSKQHSWFRNAGSRLIGRLFRDGFQTSVHPTSFRLISRQIVNSICTCQTSQPVIDVLIGKSTQRIGSVVIRHDTSRRSRSSYSVGRLAHLTLQAMASTAHWIALRLLLGGIALLALGGVLAGLALWQLRWPPLLLSALLACTGSLVAIAAIIIEFLGMILADTIGMPAYIERDSVNLVGRQHASL